MQLIPLKTPRLCPHQDLLSVFDHALGVAKITLKEKDVLIIASKIVAYSQGLLVQVNSKEDFRALVKKEADKVLNEGDMILTLKNKMLIPNAGIDNSNVPEGQVVLWPEDPFEWSQDFRKKLTKQYGLKELGVLITDSHCQPLRQGTSGLGIGWAGFEGVKDERGAEDLFGHKMQYTQIAIADNLASAATLEMGETDASVPFVIARDAKVDFTEKTASEEGYFMKPEECLYAPLYTKNMTESDD